MAFEISTKKLLVYNLFATLILSYLYVKKIIIFDTQKLISFDALLQTNATIFALMLTITVAILGTNRYIRKIQFTKIVFTGINLFFFMAYLILVIICLIYPNNFLLTLSFFMLVNSVIFMMHLIDNQKIGYILSILNKIIRDNINNKNYNPHVSSTKNTFSWSSIKGTRIETGSYDKFEDFKIAFDSLEELALDSVKNYDKKVFNEIIRNYFELGRYFLYQCGKEDKKYLSVYLFPILKLYNSIESKEYRNEIIELILNDYRCSEQFLDIKTWNLERFKLMTSILIGTSDKEGKKHIASILIKMLTIRMMEKANITYNNFSNQSYKNFKNTDEFKELKKSIKKSKIGLKNIDKLMARFRFEDEKEQKEFNKVIKNIITELKKR
ncbi:hypothetical protein J4434_06265 [Candidatus Woesearchaeota archaeon]|nr:hypothetical protein [Candidatus Woesearchaeota archaeon]